MDFVFQGFQSELPVWVYLLLIAGTVGVSWWSYKDLKTINPLYRYALIGLRSIIFLILLVLLLNPFFRSETTRYERPQVLTLFDNSASSDIEKGNYAGTESYRQLISDLNFDEINQLNFRYFSFSNEVTPSAPDRLSFDGFGTNIQNAIEVIRNNEQEGRAAILFTDGIFNQGRNPVFLARELNIPVYTIALGDTSRQRDLIVQNITTNSTGYLNTSHPINVNILNQGFDGQPFQVQLRKGDEVLQSQTIAPEASVSAHSVSFQLELEEKGLQQFNIYIPEKEGEWTDANNSQPFSVDVLDDKQSILSIAFEIHPDVGMIRSMLLQDENTQLSTRTWLGGSRFIRGNLNINADTLDLVVLQGYPSQGISQQLSNQVVELLSSVPAIIIPTPNTRFSDLPNADAILPITQSGPLPNSYSYMQVSLVPMLEETQHPVMELPEVSYDRLPAIYAPIQRLRLNPGSTTLFDSKFQGTETGQPLIAVRQIGNMRRAQLNGYGWYRIAQSSIPQASSFLETLIYNLVSWTATQPDNRRLKIQPDQKVFTGSEPVSFSAFLTNESGEVESDGVITIAISGGNMEPRLYNMNNTGSGQYHLEIGSLPEGIYQFEGVAKKGNRTIDTQKGEFSVSGSNIEYVNTRRNDELLSQIAEATGGQFYTYQNAGSIWQDMDNRGLMDQEEHIETQLFYPYQHAFWFILVIILLGIEWVLRKYVALP